MKFQLKAIAAASALVAGSVFAHAPGTPVGLEIFISGATAQDKALAKLATDLCVANLTVYQDDGGDGPGGSSDGKAHSAYFCDMDSSTVPGLSGLTAVLIHKRSAGGSGKGVQPVADEVAMEHMNINNGNCAPNGAGKYICSIGLGVAGGDLSMEVSDAGISDVEPALFVPPNVPAGDSPVTPAQLAKLVVKSQNAIVFGIPVTTALRNALQELQSLPIGSDLEDDQPSLTREQVASIFNGGHKRWNTFKDSTGASIDTVVTTAPSDNKVRICRRVPGSGTQAQFNAKFAGVPCTAGNLIPTETGSNILGPVVTLNSGSGDVDNCLVAAQNANQWAVGIQSLEKKKAEYRFIKINGVSPSLKNVADNKYFDWVEPTIQWRKPAFNGATGDMLKILEKIATDAGKPSILASLNATLTHLEVTEPGAYLALNTNGHAITVPFDPASPVVTASHDPTGGGVSNCRVPLIMGNSEM